VADRTETCEGGHEMRADEPCPVCGAYPHELCSATRRRIIREEMARTGADWVHADWQTGIVTAGKRP
jgi:hypothetical protein